MKKVFVLLLVIIFNVSAYCQIGVTSAVAPVEKKTNVVVFDSTKNFLGKYNVMSYIDQTLFVLPKAKCSQKRGYEDFYQICNFRLQDFWSIYYTHYGQDADDSEDHTRYEDLAMTYWHVDTIVSACDHKYYKQRYLFYLSNVNEPESKCAFYYNPEDKYYFPFIVLSHYNYLKKKYIGKQLIVKRRVLRGYDLSTGEEIKVTDDTKSIWTAEDLNVISNENGDQYLGMLLKQGNKRTFVEIDAFERGLKDWKIVEKKEWDKLVATYGLDMVKTAFRGEIKVGMSKKLLILAWGHPKSIKNASYGDHYVYDKWDVYVKNKPYEYPYDYNSMNVYLKNDKVTGWD